MNYSTIGVVAVSLGALVLGGCQSQRMTGISAPSSTVAEPLEPAPAGTVTSGQLPPANAGAFPEAPSAAPGTPPPGQQVASAPANAPAITAGRVAGVWNASVGGQGCRIATPQTKFGSGYRAGPLRCPAPLDGVKSWNVEGSQLALYDQSGSVLARLYSSGGERFDGQTTSGQSVSLSR